MAYVYRLTRNSSIAERREIQGKWARPRHIRPKAKYLVRFCEDNKQNWDKRREKWNKDHPEWKYESNIKMQIAYYKAKRKADQAIDFFYYCKPKKEE